MEKKLTIAIVGATGAVGQQMLQCLEERNFDVNLKLLASSRSAGKVFTFNNQKVTVEELTENSFDDVDYALGATENDLAKKWIPWANAKGVVVVDNSSAFRLDENVPLVIPEINPEATDVIKYQKERLGTKRGFIAVKPNCSIQSYTPVLTAWKEFEPYEVVVTTYQAISGAGKNFKEWPEMVGNIIPYIGGEEEKSEREPLRVWGHVDDEKKAIVPLGEDTITITSQCIRVPVLYGHTAAVFVKFRKNPTKQQLIDAMTSFSGEPQRLQLPNAPKQFIQYLEEDNRPQVTLDVNYENGFGVSVGRLREDKVYDWKFVGLSHNTIRGAAGGGVLCAELLKAKGFITKK